MSPRAACRLERFGFEEVYDYVDGIADWRAAGLPTEGAAEPVQRVADATRADVPTCSLADTIGEVRSRTFDAGWGECIVIDCGRIVVGRLRDQAWEAEKNSLVEDVMESGPSTVRSHSLLKPLVERMTDRSTSLVTVTDPQGELLGVLLRDEAERLLSGEAPEEIWRGCDGCPGQWQVRSGRAGAVG